MSNCEFVHNRFYGVTIAAAAKVTLEDCRIAANAGFGVGGATPDDERLRRCTVTDNLGGDFEE